MKITFLGTGPSTGIPMIGCDCEVCKSNDPKDKRTRCSVFIETKGKKIVIDTGPDFRQQMLTEDFKDVDAVLFTHSHKDHIAGLDEIRAINYLQNKVIDVYANKETSNRLKQEYPYIFEGNYPGVPLVNLTIIPEHAFMVGDIEITPIKAKHGDMDVLAFRIGDFTYFTDSNEIKESELEKIKRSKVFVINALGPFEHYSHFTLSQALSIIETVGADRSYLIHMSHMMGKHAAVEEKLPKNVHLSFDGLKLEL